MTNDNGYSDNPKGICLTEDDLFLYVTRGADEEKLLDIEAHAAGCADCRRALADVIELLSESSGTTTREIPPPTDPEIENTIGLIRNVARKEQSQFRGIYRRLQWPVAAALVFGIAVLLFWIQNNSESEDLYLQAKTMLEQRYPGKSPGNLRLDLPFTPAPMLRNPDEDDLLGQAEINFYQALALRKDYIEAQLGVGTTLLVRSRFKDAGEAFQIILDSHEGDIRALIGRGVARYEEAQQIDDPVKYLSLLAGALDDFNKALTIDPASPEARYNLAWVLYQSGSYAEALDEIERYLSHDGESGWAEELKNLKARIQVNYTYNLKEIVEKAAMTRDPSEVERISRHAPYRMLGELRSAMIRSLQLDQAEASLKSPGTEDLRWVAGIMESAYRKATGDSCFESMIRYYDSLTPAQQAQKKSLDKTFHRLVQMQNNGEFSAVLRESAPLKQQYIELQDTWQLLSLHHLRGYCYHMEADFENSGREYVQRLRIARQFNSPYLIARALSAWISITEEQRKFDETTRLNDELLEIIQIHDLETLKSSARITSGYQYRRTGLYEQSLKEFMSALKSAYGSLNERDIAIALENIGIGMDHLGFLQESGFFYDAALQRIDHFLSEHPDEKNPDNELRRLNLMILQGKLASRMGKFEKAISYLKECLKSKNSGKYELEARARIELAEVYLVLNRNRDAESELNRVMDINSSGEYQNIGWRAWCLRGKLSEVNTDYPGAVTAFKKSIEIIERIRRNVDSPELRNSFLTSRFDPYMRVIDLLYRLETDKTVALNFVNRAKSMTLRESLHLPNSTFLKKGYTATDTDQAVGGRILEYFFTDERLLVFVTEQDGRITETVSIPLALETVKGRVNALLEYVQANNFDDFNGISQQLYVDLITPVEQYLFDEHGTLVILPDGPLHLLPFGGLQDSNGEFIIEKTPIVYAPSRSVFQHCMASSRSIPSDGNGNVVLIDGTTGLPRGREEILFLERLYSGNTVTLGAKNLPDIRSAVTESEILHFAGHAMPVKGLLEPVLMLQEFPETIYLDSSEIASWNMPNSCLVNLAGCSTATGPIAAGEAPWGLVPAFLDAGASAIMASLMQVDDDSTRLMSQRFYDQLQKGIDKATALQKAQLTMLNRSPDESKSLAWIPYILIGNPS